MTFVSSSRRYDSDDQALAEDIAGRVAAALENARIYDIAREAIRARDDFVDLVAHELRKTLAAPLPVDDRRHAPPGHAAADVAEVRSK